MTPWSEALQASRAAFIEGLEQRGFVPVDDAALTGVLTVLNQQHKVTVRLPAAFPFKPPAVIPAEDFPRSWHRELDGAMCLYPALGREQLPWLDPSDFVLTVTRWLTESATGWPNDFPDLDLNRYFYGSTDQRLLIYSDLDHLIGRYVRLTREKTTITLVGPGAIPKKAVINKRRAFGYVADIGEPAKPPTDWNELSDLLTDGEAHRIQQAIKDRRLNYLLVAYTRHGNRAALALETHNTVGGIQLLSVPSASSDMETLTIRSGPHATTLRHKKVLVVGAGAIGSFLCDALSRGGVGHLTIRDHDIIRPGNLVRHLLDANHLGQNKAQAVCAHLKQQPYSQTKLVADARALTDPDEVNALLHSHDLIVDATADGEATAMLAAAARATGHHIISVCIRDTGAEVRVDTIPPPAGDALPPTQPTLTKHAAVIYEAGCGDPVSLTPSPAVLEAAALATRHAIGLLTNEPVSDAGDIRVYP